MIFQQTWFAENLTKQDGVFPASVPGNVQYDYASAKRWPDYQYADNCKMFSKLEDDTWAYTAVLDYVCQPGQTVWFRAKGIDYQCEIYLNDRLLLRHEGSFSRIALELTGALQKGDNRLCIIILPHPKRPGAPVGRSQADAACKAPVCYGWGWHPRLLVSGLWQDAYIEVCDPGYIFDTSVTYTLSEDLKSADVAFDWKCSQPVTVSLYDDANALVWQGSDHKAHLEHIKLWWCNDEGPQTMYTWVMESADDTKTGRIGFRRGRLLMNEGGWEKPRNFPKSRSDAPATFELNGRKIFLKGSNYLTPDIFTGRVTKETYRKQLELAKEAHMNVMRCWGGCGCQSEVFYDLCDELGILVWVEFPLACNLYPETDAYLAVLEQEATEIILRLREHPSIAFWCGGNELFNGWSQMTEQHLALRLLDTLCYRYDRSRPFLMTSPLNGMAHGNYLFFDTTTGEDSFTTFRNAANTAYTEFGVPSLGDLAVAEKIMPAEALTFPIPNDDPNWKAHYGTAIRPWQCQSDTVTCFPECKTLEEVVEYSDLLQCMSYKAIFEEARRQWPQCSMALNWCYNEPWYTMVNRHLVDYDCKPRPAYEAVKNSLRPVLATAGIKRFIWRSGEVFTADIVLHNDTNEPIEREVRVTVRLGAMEQELLCWKGECGPRVNVLAPTVRFRLPECADARLLELSVSLDDGTENRYLLRYFRRAAPPVVPMLNE